MQYDLMALFGMGALVLVALSAFVATFFTVEQRTTAIVQRFGRFVREAGPGIRAKVPFVDRVVGRVNLRVQQLDVEIETKTEDNVFVRMVVAVQYYVLPEKVYDAFYKLENAHRQITSFVFDVVRAQVPKIKLDDVFEKKDDIADIVKSELAQVMEGFGYGFLKAPVTDIDPDSNVKQAMNEINAAQRMRVAATERGEADRILKVKAAEGEAQSKALQGRGIADGERLAGVLTYGDVLKGLAEQGANLPVRQAMRGEPRTASPSESLGGALTRIHEDACRVLMVVENETVVGLLTAGNIGELLALEAAGRTYSN